MILSILIMTVGVGWLLTALDYAPGINWIVTLSLGVLGFLIFIISGGVDKLSIVLGPFFLISSFLSILRQTGRLRADIEVPILVILIGALLLVAQMTFIRLPQWVVASSPDDG